MIVYIIKTVAQILILATFFYRFYAALTQNKAERIVISLAVYGFLYLICLFLDFSVLQKILKAFVIPLVVFLSVLYQPELRRTFIAGFLNRRRLFRISDQTSSDEIDDILEACQRLVQVKRGALIVFPRSLQLKNIIDSGTKMNADISTALIVTVFDHDTPLHDGAMIIQGSKIVACGCYLPLSGQSDIKASFGTRHRAALGMAEESDAIIIIVSEETGAISLAYNGNIYYQLDVPVIKNTILALLANHDIIPDEVEGQINEEE